MATSKDALTGAQKAAILCMALGPKGAATVLRRLGQPEVEAIARHIAEMPTVDAETVTSVVREFQEQSRSAMRTTHGGVDYAQTVLSEALGDDRARQLAVKFRREVSESRFHTLKRAAPEVLAGVLRGEHPQTIALILAHLDLTQAAAVIQSMEPEQAGDILHRMAHMEKIAPEMLTLVEAGLSSKTDLSFTQA